LKAAKRLRGLAEAGQIPDVKVLHAGTRRQGDAIVTSGGRVLGVTATGDSLASALPEKPTRLPQRFHFDGMPTAKTSADNHQQSTTAGD